MNTPNTKNEIQADIVLTVSDVLRIVRKKKHITQGKLGAQAYNTNESRGQARIKKFECGDQTPTVDDIVKIAEVLGISPDLFHMHVLTTNVHPGGVMVSQKLLDMFPALGEWIHFFNSAANLNQKDTIIDMVKKLVAEHFCKCSPKGGHKNAV